MSTMCVQCAMGAAGVAAGATGIRAWLVIRFGRYLTPGRRRMITGVLITGGVLASGLVGPTP
jgi:hypothetical protein